MRQPPKHVFELSNNLEEICVLEQTIEAWGEKYHIAVKVISAMTLMLDELVTNIVMHGYPDGADGRIQVSLAMEEGTMVATLSDWAPAFDPFSIATPDTTLPIEEREIGGLGIHFVRQMADKYQYRRNANANEICIHKK